MASRWVSWPRQQTGTTQPFLRPTLEKLARFETLLGVGLPEQITVHLDAGYDSTKTRDLLDELGCTGVISTKGFPLRPTSQPAARPSHRLVASGAHHGSVGTSPRTLGLCDARAVQPPCRAFLPRDLSAALPLSGSPPTASPSCAVSAEQTGELPLAVTTWARDPRPMPVSFRQTSNRRPDALPARLSLDPPMGMALSA